MSEKQRDTPGAMIIFYVKYTDFFGMANQYVAEAFLMLKDIIDRAASDEEIKLKLTKIKNEG